MRIFKTALLAGALGLALAPAAASAQDYDSDIVVSAPRFQAAPQRLNGPLEKLSLSTRVPYNDLDLRSWRGAHELRLRVRDAAQDTCMRLAEAYPVYQQPGTNCYKTALRDGELRADEAIRDARSRVYYASYRRY